VRVSRHEHKIEVMRATDQQGSRGKSCSAFGTIGLREGAGRRNPQASYYRARYYDSSAGRFLSEDPIGFKGGMNFYAYVRNTAVNMGDSFGLQKNKCSWAGGCSDMPLPWMRKPCGSGACKNNAVSLQIRNECNKYNHCVLEELGKSIADNMAGDPLGALNHVKPPDPNPTHDSGDPITVGKPDVGLGDLLKMGQSAFLKALQDCFQQHPLAGLDPGFNAVDVGQESTGPTWFESFANGFSKIFH
jgi:RHS repeat-associated protein